MIQSKCQQDHHKKTKEKAACNRFYKPLFPIGGEGVEMSKHKDPNLCIQYSTSFSKIQPVSYTHLDVYKRQVHADDAQFTNPGEVEEFVTKTGVDSLAIAIGTSHGAYKFKPGQKPQLRFDILEEVSRRLPGFPIVLHGASSVPQDLVKVINQYGGQMPDAIGIPEDRLRKAASMAVCKINIDSDVRVAMTAAIRKYFAEHPDHFDPRQYLTPARTAVKDMVSHKINEVLGCAGKA